MGLSDSIEEQTKTEAEILKAMYEAAKDDLEDVMKGHEETDNLLLEIQAENKWLREQTVFCPFCCHSFKVNWAAERDRIDNEVEN